MISLIRLENKKKIWNIIRIRNQLNLYLDKWFMPYFLFCFILPYVLLKKCQPHSLSDLICLFIRISKKKSTANQYAWIAKWKEKNQTQFKSSHAEYEPKQKMEINKAYAVEKMYLCWNPFSMNLYRFGRSMLIEKWFYIAYLFAKCFC